MKSTYDLLIWVAIFLLIALIFGLYIAEKHKIPDSLFMRTKAVPPSPYMEHYSKSSDFDISGGASSKYGWGVSDDYERTSLSKRYHEHDHDHEEKEKPKSEKCSKKDEEEKKCIRDDLIKTHGEICKTCDILEHPDMEKYVLKSSVPPCPNMTDYIHKSKIPACPNIDLNDYIKKSEIPKPKECPVVEKCPTCPEIPKDLKYRKEIKNINEFIIMNTDDIELLLKDKRVKEYLDQNYEKKNNIPQPNSSTSSSSASTKSSPYAEESHVSSSEYIPTSTLWNEIKSLFGFKKIEEEESQNQKTQNQTSQNQNQTSQNQNQTSQNQNQTSQNQNQTTQNQNQTKSAIHLTNYYSEEEEKSMIYNQNCEKPKLSDQNAMYAGDNLYSVAQF